MRRLMWCAMVLLCGCHAGADLRCSNAQQVVVRGSASEAEAICVAAGRALEFFAAQNLDVDTPVTIRIVEHLSGSHSGQPIGHYDPAGDYVEIVSLEEARRSLGNKPPFGIDFDLRMYQSFVAHEVAHAVATRNFAYENPTRVAQEYLAYSAQLATLPPELREEVLQSQDVEAFTDVHEMTILYYALNPNAFAVKSYRHYVLPDNGDRFLAALLKGVIRPGA